DRPPCARMPARGRVRRFEGNEESMGEAFIGVDVGTGSARAGVFDAEGRLQASAKRPIAIWREPGEIVEHSSRDVWDAASAAVRVDVARAWGGCEAVAAHRCAPPD